MPSGAKKRKAAKKKIENQNQNESNHHSDSASTHAHPHGEDDRESDVGEVSSPMSQHHQKLPIEEENGEIEKDDPSSAGTRENEIKIEDESGKKDEIIGHGDETASPGGSSIVAGDESHDIKKGNPASSIASVESLEVADSFCDASTAEDGDLAPEPVEFDENGKKKCCSAKVRASMSESSSNATPPGKEAKALKECATQENGDGSASPCIASTAAVDNEA